MHLTIPTALTFTTYFTHQIFVRCGLNLEEKSPKDEDGATPLHVAAKHGQFDICKLLCLNLKEKNPKDESGRTPVDIAYHNKQWEILHFLIAENNFHCS